MYGLNNGIPVSLKSIPSFGIAPQNQLTAAIQSLFWDGSQGWWYDDDDTSTLFQDSAGTTPVTAVEQFVGLQLDKSKGLVLGPELVTNGDFSQGSTGWTLSTVSVSNGTLNATGSNGTARQTINVSAGKTYEIRWRIVNYTAGTISVQLVLNGVQVTVYTSPNTPGDYVVRQTASSTINQVQFAFTGSPTASIDNISVRELPGNHRYAPASGNRPVWSKRVNLLERTEDFTNAYWGKNAAVTVTQSGNVGTISVPNTIGSGVNILFRQSITTIINTTSRVEVRGPVGLSITLADDFGSSPAAFTGDWQTITLTTTGTGSFHQFYIRTVNASQTYSFDIRFPDLRPANQATGTIPLYQRVNTSTDYDTNGFPGYLKADGIDDFLQTNSIDFNTVTSDGQPRRNLLNNPTQFDTATWSKLNASVTATNGIAPNGTATANTLTENTANAAHGLQVISVYTGTSGKTNSIYVKASGRNRVALGFSSSSGLIANTSAVYDLATGTVVTQPASPSTASIFSVGDGWYRIVLLTNAGNVNEDRFVLNMLRDTDVSPTAYTGDGVSGVLVWGAQAEVGSTATAFQNIGTDKVTLCAGVRKLSDAATGLATELSATIDTNNGTFNFTVPSQNGSNSYRFSSKGTTAALAGTGVFAAAPDTSVLTGIGDISGDVATLRRNGAVVVTVTTDQGTGNYGNYPAYFFRRGGTTIPFNGYEYGNVAVGKLLTADQLTALETYMNEKTRAY